MTRPVIFLPEPFPPTSLEVIPELFEIRQGDTTRRYEEDERNSALQGMTALAITSREQITARVIGAASDLKAIGKTGAIPTNVDKAAAEARCIALVWSPTANSRSVAEITLGLMLVKRVPEMTDILRSGGWCNYDVLGPELATMTVGLVALGNIGRTVTRLLNAIGARVIAHDPGIAPAETAEMGVEWCRSRHCLPEPKYFTGLQSRREDWRHRRRDGLCRHGEGTYLVGTPTVLGALVSGRVP